jgi:hypothetical protein
MYDVFSQLEKTYDVFSQLEKMVDNFLSTGENVRRFLSTRETAMAVSPVRLDGPVHGVSCLSERGLQYR